MRALTGRDRIIKIEGCYHGHHDSVQVSVLPEAEEVGPADRAEPRHRATSGIPQADPRPRDSSCPSTTSPRSRGASTELPGEVAGMILEPIMMNAGIIHPEAGYLAGLRDLLHRARRTAHIRRGQDGPDHRARRRDHDVRRDAGPHLPGQGDRGRRLPTAAIGGRRGRHGDDRRRTLRAGGHLQRQPAGDGRGKGHPHRGADPRGVRAARAACVFAWSTASRRSSTEYGLPWRVISAGAKGCVSFRPGPVRNYRDFLGIDDRYGNAHWLVQHNGGVFLPPWGKVEQWLISVQHTDDDIDLFVANVESGSRTCSPAATAASASDERGTRPAVAAVARQAVRRPGGRRRPRPGDRRRGVLLAARRVRMRQDDDAAHDRRVRASRTRARYSSTARTSCRCRRTSDRSTRSSSRTRCFPS